jgi:hypothetical protein
MIRQSLAGRGALERRGRPTLASKLKSIGNIVDHLGCSLMSVFQPGRERIGVDPAASASQEKRQQVIPIDRVKVLGDIKPRILARRPAACEFTMENSGRLAVVIPYRDREHQLRQLISALDKTLAAQQRDYRIVVAEQSDDGLFNRGKIKNVGADLVSDWSDYYCFHDVDHVPENADYGCPSQPLRLVKHYSQTHRRDNPIRGYLFGGVVTIRRDQFEAINGYDNSYWGWGQEDEDLFLRCLLAGLVPHEDTQGVYRELDNPNVELAERTFLVRRRNRYLMKAAMLNQRIGRSGLSDLEYRVVSSNRSGKLLHVRVDI